MRRIWLKASLRTLKAPARFAMTATRVELCDVTVYRIILRALTVTVQIKVNRDT